MKLTVLLLTLFCATADDCQKQAQAAEKGCADDVQKLCKGVPPHQIPKCMKKHWKQVSKPCQNAAKALMGCVKCVPEQKKAASSCGPWIKKTCPKAKDAKGYWDCYLDNRSKAPKQCNADATVAYKCIATHTIGIKCKHHAAKGLKQNCHGQFHKMCPKAKSHADYRKCVKANWKKFSGACQAVMMRLHKCEMCGISMFNRAKQCGEPVHHLCGSCQGRKCYAKCVRKNWSKVGKSCQKAMKWTKKACPCHHHHHHHGHHGHHQHLLGRDGHDNWRHAGDHARHAVMSWMHHFTGGHRHHRRGHHCRHHHGHHRHHKHHKDHKYCNGLECHDLHHKAKRSHGMPHGKKQHLLGQDDHDNWRHNIKKHIEEGIQHVTKIFVPTFEHVGDVAELTL